MRAANTYGTKLPSKQPIPNAVQPHKTATYDALALAYGIPRHAVERTERRAMEKLLLSILIDHRIINHYGGCLVSLCTACCQSLGITQKQFVKYASKDAIRRYWCL